VQQAISACKRKGLFKDYDDALEAVAKSDEQAKSLQRAIANTKKKGDNETSQSLQDDLKTELKEALLEKKASEGRLTEAAKGFFSLYTDILSEDACFCWDKIVASQVGTAPWTDLSPCKGTSTLKSGGRVSSPFRIVSPSTYWTCSQVTLRNNSASISAMC
jgi:hypothetical protein